MVEPVTLTLVRITGGAFLGAAKTLLGAARSLVVALMPLAFGVICAAGAVGAYPLDWPPRTLADFFTAASGVGVGVLIALMLERQTDHDAPEGFDEQLVPYGRAPSR